MTVRCFIPRLRPALFWLFASVFPCGFTSAQSGLVSFSKEIAPVVSKKCVTCHNAEKMKGGYRLDTYALMFKPGKSKRTPIVPGAPEASRLFELLTAKDPDDRMPQKDDPLPVAQVKLIQNWIQQGARFDGGSSNQTVASLAHEFEKPKTPVHYAVAPPVFALAYSPDGRSLAATGYGEITIWNPRTGKLLRRIPGLSERIQALAWAPSEDSLLAAAGTPGLSGELIIVDAPATEHPRPRAIANASDLFLDAVFSPDGKTIASAGTDNSIRLYEFPSGRERAVIQQHADWVNCIVFSHDSRRIASASRDRTCRVFDASTGELETTYTGHDGPVMAIAFSSDDKLLCSAARDKKIHLWQVSDARKTNEIAGLDGDVLNLGVYEQRLFVCGADKLAREYDLEGKKLRVYEGHSDWIYALCLDPLRGRVATGGFDGEVRIWNLETGIAEIAFKAAPGMGEVAGKQH